MKDDYAGNFPFTNLTQYGPGTPGYDSLVTYSPGIISRMNTNNGQDLFVPSPNDEPGFDVDHTVFQADFTVGQDVADITRLRIEFNGARQYASYFEHVRFGIYNFEDDSYDLVRTEWLNDGSTNDENVNINITSDISDYVDGSGKVSIVIVNEDEDSNSAMFIDKLNLRVDYEEQGDPVPGDGMSFDYTITDGDETDTASVDVQVQTGDTLTGGDDGEIFISADSADAIYGNGGDDYIVGGGGNDTISGGEGDDVFAYTSAGDGEDVITDFEVGEDTIDLDALFDELDIDTADREGDLVITDTGDDVTIEVTGATGFSITLEDVDADTTAELDALKSSIVVGDES